MNINALRDQDTSGPLFYAAGCGPVGQQGWPGAVLYISTDGGTVYNQSVVLDYPATIGTTSDALANWTGGFDVTDTASHVNVVMTHGTLASLSPDAFLAGGNAALIGGELVYFQNAHLETDGSYTLTNFLRARRGTDYFMNQHAAGDRFVLIETAALKVVQMQKADIGASYNYKAVTVGGDITTTPAQSFLFQGANLKPYSGVDAAGARDGSSNLTITWTRRDKAAGDLLYGATDLVMSEVTESYEIDIFSDNTYTTVKRTLTASTPSVTYTSAQQVTDFGANQSTVYCKIYQISAVVGRGYPLKASL